MSEVAIRVTNLVRSFDNFTAVDDISFEVKKGAVCGFVGANGAGKTTTMRILSTLDDPTSGSVEVAGIDVVAYPEKVRQVLGWMPDHFGHYQNMTVLEYIDFYARSYGFKGEEREQRVREVMEFTDLLEIQDRFSNKLSKGMTQRLCLARTLLHDPEVLILDEPAAGLDPKARVELKQLLRLLSEDGKTILISSHILSELGEMCDSMLFINQGKIIHQGDADSLKERGQKEEEVYYVELFGDASELADWEVTTPYATLIEETKQGGRLQVTTQDQPEIAADLLQQMVKRGMRVREFRREQRNLETAFIDILEEEK